MDEHDFSQRQGKRKAVALAVSSTRWAGLAEMAFAGIAPHTFLNPRENPTHTRSLLPCIHQAETLRWYKLISSASFRFCVRKI